MSLQKSMAKEIQHYLSKDVDYLFIKLAETEYASRKYSYAAGKKTKEQGLEVFRSLKSSLFQKICVEWEYCKKKDDPILAEDINLVAAIIDIIASVTIGIPPALIAVILFKKGLSAFCKCGK